MADRKRSVNRKLSPPCHDKSGAPPSPLLEAVVITPRPAEGAQVSARAVHAALVQVKGCAGLLGLVRTDVAGRVGESSKLARAAFDLDHVTKEMRRIGAELEMLFNMR